MRLTEKQFDSEACLTARKCGDRTLAGKARGDLKVCPVFCQYTMNLEDGAEALWRQYTNRTVKTIQALAKSKKELEVFNDETLD